LRRAGPAAEVSDDGLSDYTDYMTWYQKRNYDVLNADAEAAD
jgi:hypothetical protein